MAQRRATSGTRCQATIDSNNSDDHDKQYVTRDKMQVVRDKLHEIGVQVTELAKKIF